MNDQNQITITIYPVEFYRRWVMWRWRVKASNGKIVGASSEGFWKRKACEKNSEILGTALAHHHKINGTQIPV